MVRLLLSPDIGAEGVSAPCENGSTPVTAAASKGHLPTLRALVEMGADPSTPNQNGWGAVHAAAEKGYETMMRALITEFGVSHRQATNKGSTPLYRRIDGS